MRLYVGQYHCPEPFMLVLILTFSFCGAAAPEAFADASQSSQQKGSGYKFGHRARHVVEGPFLPDGTVDHADTKFRQIALSEVRDASTGEWSGHRIWPGAIALLEHLHRTRGDTLVGLRILELGCGLPFAAAVLAGLGAEVCATDHPDALPFADAVLRGIDDGSAGTAGAGAAAAASAARGGSFHGLTAAARSRLRLRPLAWGRTDDDDARARSTEWGIVGTHAASSGGLAALCNFSGPIDLVVGADLVYDAYPWEPLAETVSAVLQEHKAVAVLALQPRRFPMVSNLNGPPRVHQFLKSLAAGGLGKQTGALDVNIEKPRSEARELLGREAVDGLLLATVAAPTARERAVAPTASRRRGWLPLGYRQELLESSPTDRLAADSSGEAGKATRQAEL